MASYNLSIPCPTDYDNVSFEIDLTTELISPPDVPFNHNSLMVYLTSNSGTAWASNYPSNFGLTEVITDNPWIGTNPGAPHYQPAAPYLASTINEGTHTIKFTPFYGTTLGFSPSDYHLQISQFTDGSVSATGQTWNVTITDIRICYDPVNIVGDTQTVACYTTGTATMNGSDTETGSWTLGAGSAGTATINNPSSPTTTVTGFSVAGTYNMVWTNTNGCVQQTAIIANNDCCVPQIVCPANITVSCHEDHIPILEGQPDTTGSTCPVTLTYTDSPMTGGCNAQTGQITRTFRAALTSDLTKFVECTQTITVMDFVPPVFTSVNGNMYRRAQPTLAVPADDGLINYIETTTGYNEVLYASTSGKLGPDPGTITDYVSGSSSTVLWRVAVYPISATCENGVAIDALINYRYSYLTTPIGPGDHLNYAYAFVVGSDGTTYDVDMPSLTILEGEVLPNTDYKMHLVTGLLPYNPTVTYNLCIMSATIGDDGTNHTNFDITYSFDHFNVIMDNSTCPKDTTYVSCPADIPPAGTMDAMDDCGTSTVTMAETTTGTEPCDYIFTRTWTATDECANTNEYSKTYVVKDETPPMFSTVRGNIYQITPTFQTASGDLYTYLNSLGTPYEWAQGVEGTLGRDMGQVSDVIPGSAKNILMRVATYPFQMPDCASATSDIDVQFDFQFSSDNNPIGTGEGIAYAFIVGYDGTNYDLNIANVVQQIPVNEGVPYTLRLNRSSLPQSPYYFLCFAAATLSSDGTEYRDYDYNYSINQLKVYIDQTTCSKDTTTISCFADIPADGTLSAVDACGTSEVTWSDTHNEALCNYHITRTWIATDVCGNSNQYSLTYYINDSTGPVFNDEVVTTSYDASATTNITDWLSTLNNWQYEPMTIPGQFGPHPGTPQDYGASPGVTTLGTAAAYPVPTECGPGSTINIGSTVTVTLDEVITTNPPGNSMDVVLAILGETAGAYSILSADVHTFVNGVAGQQAFLDIDGNNLPYHDNYYVLLMANTIEDTDDQHYTSSFGALSITSSCADTIDVYCEEELPSPVRAYTDNCGATGDATYTDSRTPATGDNFTLTRTFTATDVCGNTTTSQIVYQIEFEAPCEPLPLDLLTFTVQKSGKTSLLNWTTTNEVNTDRFIIQRSQDGKSFADLGSVMSLNNANAVNKYNYVDNNPFNGINYYRLRNVDQDGKFTYSAIRSVTFDNVSKFSVYPNPINSNNQAYVTGEGFQTLYLYDNYGHQVREYKNLDPKVNSYRIDLTNLASGFYYLRNDVGQTEKLIVK